MKSFNTYKTVGEYKFFDSCRFCGSLNIKIVVDLGLLPLAGGFIKPKENKRVTEKFYPLKLVFCEDCFLLQVNSSISPDTLFKNYFYFSSSMKTLVQHFENIASDLPKILPNPNDKFVVEIGANDGAFIKALQKIGYKALGIDPAANVVKSAIKNGIPILNDYFTQKLAGKIVKKYGRADSIYSFHSMAHIENMHDVIHGIKTLLKKDGFLAIEVHYLGDLIREIQYDMIYHEHQFYYSLLSLKNFFQQYEMEIFDVKHFNVRGGSIMYFVQNKGGGKRVTKSVKDLLKQEKMRKLDKADSYIRFSKKISLRKKQLILLLNKLKKDNKKVVGYGASGRGTIIANYSDLTNYLDYIVDDAKAKQGSLLPGTHHEIFPSNKMIQDNVDFAVLFAWPFLKEVKARNKNFRGKFIIPLPNVKIV